MHHLLFENANYKNFNGIIIANYSCIFYNVKINQSLLFYALLIMAKYVGRGEQKKYLISISFALFFLQI